MICVQQHNNTTMSASSTNAHGKTLSLKDVEKIEAFLKKHTLEPGRYERFYIPYKGSGESMIPFMVASREFAISINSKYFPCHYYQKYAILIYMEEHQINTKYAPKIQKLNKVKFHAPQGGTFDIYGRWFGDTYEYVLERDDGSWSICRLHYGYDSEELLGVKIESEPKYVPSE